MVIRITYYNLYLVKNNFWSNILRCSTKCPCLSSESNSFGETKINLKITKTYLHYRMVLGNSMSCGGIWQ